MNQNTSHRPAARRGNSWAGRARLGDRNFPIAGSWTNDSCRRNQGATTV